jgi:hypothetical protein
VDDTDLTENLRNNPEIVTKQLDSNFGLMLALVPISYSQKTKMADGSYIYLQASIPAGETFALNEISERDREILVENQHYAVKFTEQDKANVRYAHHQAELNYFQPTDGSDIYLNPGALR